MSNWLLMTLTWNQALGVSMIAFSLSSKFIKYVASSSSNCLKSYFLALMDIMPGTLLELKWQNLLCK
jgi:hypothetical protein